MDEESPAKIAPPTQHISFEDQEAEIVTGIPKQTVLTHPDMSEEEVQEFIQKYNIKLSYKPEDNFRKISYLVLGLGFTLAIYIGLSGDINRGNSGQGCCGVMLLSMCIAYFFDAAHYSKKKEWQQKHAMDHKSSDNSIAINITLGIFLLFFFILVLINL